MKACDQSPFRGTAGTVGEGRNGNDRQCRESAGLLLLGGPRPHVTVLTETDWCASSLPLKQQRGAHQHSCRLQLLYGPISVVPCRAKSPPLPRVSILFRPQTPDRASGETFPFRSHRSITRPRRNLVEAPGTAPGSTTLIPRPVYRHSRISPAPLDIGAFAFGLKGDRSGCRPMPISFRDIRRATR